MASQTVYPYGIGGELPSGIAIVNDCVTGGADKALAAEQGKVLMNIITDLVDEASNRNYINGKYLKSNGTAENDETKFISNKIPAVKGDVIYWRYGSNASMYLIEYDESGVKLNEWIANSSTGRSITLTRDTTAYIRASFNANSFATSYINKNGTRAWTASDGDAGGIITELTTSRDAIFSGGSFEKPITGLTWSNDGIFINRNGEYDSYSNCGHSNVFPVFAGVTILAEVYAGVGTCTIAFTDESGNVIKCGPIGKSTPIQKYTFTPDEDGYAVVSCFSMISHPYVAFVYDASSLSSSGSDEEIVFSGSIVGADDTLVAGPIFPAKKGDYFHIKFPDGNWSTKSNRESYNKIIWQYGGSGGAISRAELAREGWVVPEYGYDVYVSPITSMEVTYGRLHIRATAGVEVPFVVYRLSKTNMKPYFADEMSDTIKKVKAVQSNASFTFSMISDLHYRDLEEGYRPFAIYSPLSALVNIREISKHIRLDNVVCLGDVIDGRWGAASAMADADDQMEFFARIGVPLLNCIGNHDDNRYYSQQGGDRRLTQAEIYSSFIQGNDERISIDGAMNGCNYYRDVDRHKLRIIALMPINFNGQYDFTSSTQAWLTSTLSSMPSGYKAVIITHVSPVSAQNWSGSGYTGGGAIETIITNNKDKVICLFNGHTHIDNVYMSPWPAVNIGCQKVYNSESGTNAVGSSAPEGAWWPLRAAGDYRENLWDVVVLNQTLGLLSCIRFGAGVDRYIHYDGVSVAPGGSITLTPSVITATSWSILDSQSEQISVSDGAVSVSSSATSGTALTVIALDEDGNREYWPIKVS